MIQIKKAKLNPILQDLKFKHVDEVIHHLEACYIASLDEKESIDTFQVGNIHHTTRVIKNAMKLLIKEFKKHERKQGRKDVVSIVS